MELVMGRAAIERREEQQAVRELVGKVMVAGAIVLLTVVVVGVVAVSFAQAVMAI